MYIEIKIRKNLKPLYPTAVEKSASTNSDIAMPDDSQFF
jgi:hypothetical protein